MSELAQSVGAAAGAAAGTALLGPGMGTQVGAAAGSFLGGMVGPNYTPGGGGEIRRGLAADNWPSWRLETYIKWLSLYHPDVYNGVRGVSMYNLPGIGTPGQWNGALSRAILETDSNGNRLRQEGGNWTLDKDGNVVDGPTTTNNAGSGGTGVGSTYRPPPSKTIAPNWLQRQWKKIKDFMNGSNIPMWVFYGGAALFLVLPLLFGWPYRLFGFRGIMRSGSKSRKRRGMKRRTTRTRRAATLM